MKYRRCGKSGILLPELSLGLWHNFGDNASFTNCSEMVSMSKDSGITHYDIAKNDVPKPVAAEENVGRILKQNPDIKMEEILISTKAGHEMWPGVYGNGCSRKMLITSLEHSLKRMQLEYVDIFYAHRYDPETPLEETLQALVDIVKSGKAFYIGISKYPDDKALFAYEYLKELYVPCLIHQARYSMLVRDPENGVIDNAHKNGAGFIAFSPLAQGLLTDKYLHGIPHDSRIAKNEGFLTKEALTDELINKIRALTSVAQKRG